MRFTTQPTVQTYNGWTAYSLSNKQELIKLCLTSFFSSDFYEKDSEKITRIQEYAKNIDTNFLFNLAIFSREYGLRSINHVLFIETAQRIYWKEGTRKKLTDVLTKMIRRPDELLDIVWYYAQRNGMNFNSIILPNALKFAVKQRLESFNDYQLAKYRGKGDAINLYDLISLVHAKSDSIDKLMKWNLESADTWEVEISKNWNTKESWVRLLKENKLGALATIRNLRNMLSAWVGNEEIVKAIDSMKWKDVFPFQAIQALDILDQNSLMDSTIHDVIMKNIKTSFQNIAENYKGKIAIGVDLSGSMYGTPVSNLSALDRARMALYYGDLLREVTWGDLYFWGTDIASYKDGMTIGDMYHVPPRWGWGTEVSTLTDVCQWKGYDYLIILTDEQIADRLINVASKQTIIWGLHDMQNTIANGNGITYFTWYNDIMWKVWSDLFRLWELEKEISK